MAKLDLRPEMTAYAGEDGNSVRQTKLGGGASRTRRDKLGTARMYDVRFFVDRDGFIYFNAFHDTTIGEGSMPFQIDMVVDDLELQEYTAKIVAGTLQRPAELTAKTAFITMRLEVLPNIVNDLRNAAIVAAWDAGERKDLHLITAPSGNPPTANGLIGDRTDSVGTVVTWDITQFFNGPDLSYSATGLPSGLSLGNASGLMTGTLLSNQPSSPVTITATNVAGTFTQSFNWTVV